MATIFSLTDPAAVLRAMAEYDRLTRDAFLERYEFGRAKWWYVVHEGRQYDSKAIAGVAVGYQTGLYLTASDFTGGESSVVRRLRSLGFTVLRTEVTEDTVELAEEVADTFPEGMRRTVTVNRAERSVKARLGCIEIHGTACSVCSMSFEALYGDEFADLIHVHHLNPLSGRTQLTDVNPRTDLRPVCPNCHAAIHYRRGNRKIEDVRASLEQQRLRAK